MQERGKSTKRDMIGLLDTLQMISLSPLYVEIFLF